MTNLRTYPVNWNKTKNTHPDPLFQPTDRVLWFLMNLTSTIVHLVNKLSHLITSIDTQGHVLVSLYLGQESLERQTIYSVHIYIYTTLPTQPVSSSELFHYWDPLFHSVATRIVSFGPFINNTKSPIVI